LFTVKKKRPTVLIKKKKVIYIVHLLHQQAAAAQHATFARGQIGRPQQQPKTHDSSL